MSIFNIFFFFLLSLSLLALLHLCDSNYRRLISLYWSYSPTKHFCILVSAPLWYFSHLSVVVKKLTFTFLSGTILHYIWSKLSIIILINWCQAWTETSNCAIWDKFSKPYEHRKNKRNHIQSPICTILMHILVGLLWTLSHFNLEIWVHRHYMCFNWIWTFVRCKWTNSRIVT